MLLANLMPVAVRLGPADSKSGLGAFGRLSACADRPSRAKICPRMPVLAAGKEHHAAERPQT